MFARFRRVRRRLIVDLLATHLVDGKVKSEHIGRLGSVVWAESIAAPDRIAFWGDLSRRFRNIEARRGERLADDDRRKALAAINDRIPRPTAAEVRREAARLIASVREQPSWAA